LIQVSLVDYSAADRQSWLTDRLFAPIRADFPGVRCVFDDERERGRGYYTGLRFHIHAADSSGRLTELVDGGPVDWTQTLLSSHKERCVISGIGSERVCTEFGSPA